MSEEFCLSDKIIENGEQAESFYLERDVKEFVKKVKEYDDFESNHDKKRFDEFIDTLAGKELTE